MSSRQNGSGEFFPEYDKQPLVSQGGELFSPEKSYDPSFAKDSLLSNTSYKESNFPSRPVTSLDAARIGPGYMDMTDAEIIAEIDRRDAANAQINAQKDAEYRAAKGL